MRDPGRSWGISICCIKTSLCSSGRRRTSTDHHLKPSCLYSRKNHGYLRPRPPHHRRHRPARGCVGCRLSLRLAHLQPSLATSRKVGNWNSLPSLITITGITHSHHDLLTCPLAPFKVPLRPNNRTVDSAGRRHALPHLAPAARGGHVARGRARLDPHGCLHG